MRFIVMNHSSHIKQVASTEMKPHVTHLTKFQQDYFIQCRCNISLQIHRHIHADNFKYKLIQKYILIKL